MLSKFSSMLKPRSGTSGLGSDDDTASRTDVVGRVKELHPNMSIFQQDVAEVPFPTPSPPVSPSKHGRGGMLKRMSRQAPIDDSQDTLPRFGLSKKVKSLANIATGSDHSLGRASAELLARQSEEQGRPSMDSVRTPVTPIAESKLAGEGRFGSLRSILKPKDTPGTGQSVRFFSRDAYRVISPEQSSASEMDDASLFNRLQRSAPSRPALKQVFSAPPPIPPPKDPEPTTPGIASMMMPISPPDVSNIFDVSSADEMPTIPTGLAAPLLDSAVEISDLDDQGSISLDSPDGKDKSISAFSTSPTMKLGALHDRSQSFSFGQTVFRSAASGAAAESSPAKPLSLSQRNRALSDTIFTSMIHSPSTALADVKRPEADINDTSKAVVAYHRQSQTQSPPGERDPFAANAATYYTPGTMMPPSPPQSNHTRTASREEDLIWSLRTQLALQSELCAQYEVDLSAKDELLEILNGRLSDADRELERRKGTVRAWRKRVADLEKCVRGLEDVVERSREESVDRSVMDEASGEALRMLHRRIGELERERTDGDAREAALRAELADATARLEGATRELASRDQSERALKAGIRAAKEEMEQMGRADAPVSENERERHAAAQNAWEEERAELVAQSDALRAEHAAVQAQVTSLREEVVRKEEDLAVLKAELEAQWKHTEHSSEEMEKLRQERDTLAKEVEELREKLAGADSDWEDHENKRAEYENEIQEAWAVREELEKEREELEQHLRAEQEHAEELTRALQEREDRVSTLEQERQYAYDSVARLQENLRQRDAELAEYTQRVRAREAEAEELREGLTRQKREHARIVDEQSRKIAEVVAREVEARAALEGLVKDKAENDIAADSLKERVNALKEEIEKLRRQVHELQQESADKEVKLAQAAKQRAQDKEDMQGLNIALDSKQQELELLKRRMGTRTSVGQTPAAKAPLRRESSIFATPSVVRPSSAMSDASSVSKDKDVPSTARSTLARSIRPNGSVINAATRRLESSTAPSAMKGRTSFATPSATPSRTPSVTSSAARPSSATPLARTHRRTASSLESLRGKGLVSSRESATSSVSEQDEKENMEDVTPVVKKNPRRMSVALPA